MRTKVDKLTFYDMINIAGAKTVPWVPAGGYTTSGEVLISREQTIQDPEEVLTSPDQNIQNP